jgi:hypothetical protein
MGANSGIGNKAEISPRLLTRIADFISASLYGGETTAIRVVLTDEDGDYLASSGGGGAGGGASTYSTAQEDMTVAVNPGTSTFTISPTRFPVTIEPDHIISGGFCKVKLASTGNTEDCDLTNVDVSGTVVTLADQAVFATGDQIFLKLEGPLKHDDPNQDAEKSIVYNPDYAHYTDPENWSLTDVTGIQRTVVNMSSFRHMNFQYSYSQTGAQTATMKAYKSNVASADTTTLTNWIDCSTGLLGSATIVLASTGSFEGYGQTGPVSPLKYMLEIDITAAGTGVDMASDVYIRKFY